MKLFLKEKFVSKNGNTITPVSNGVVGKIFMGTPEEFKTLASDPKKIIVWDTSDFVTFVETTDFFDKKSAAEELGM